VTDVFDLDADDDLREQIEKAARHLYGLVHARYIVTTRGLAKMVSDKLPKYLLNSTPKRGVRFQNNNYRRRKIEKVHLTD
jgi:casein kinase II subunit beta